MFKGKNDLEEKLSAQRKLAEENDAKRRAAQYNFPYLNLVSTKAPTEMRALELVSEETAKKAKIAPLQEIRKKLVIAVFNPSFPETQKILEDLKKKFELEIFISSLSGLEHAWEYYAFASEEQKEISGKIEINNENLKNLSETIRDFKSLDGLFTGLKNPLTSQLLEIILGGALALKASDIHFEPKEESRILRFRIDGLLHSAYEGFSENSYKSIVMRIKLLSGMKLNIVNEAQDGRFTIDLKDRDIEIRTSIIPSEYGETVVMRLLDPLALKTNLEDLGWRKDDLDIIKKILAEPNGLVLNTGPTGSGKTTTLYAFLKHVQNPEIKIITIEDPIEYHLNGISQTQVNNAARYTFASGLRSILRQDPDVVLVGEIRDTETAEIALNASLTGHMVFSTLHTNDAVGAIPRLLDLGIKTQTLGPALTLVIAQRLVRVLCPHCKEKMETQEDLKMKIQRFVENLPARVDKSPFKTFEVFKPHGCPECGGLGYRGRTSIFELFVIDENLEQAIYKTPNEIELKNLAKGQGMTTMQEDGILKVLKGITSMEEVQRLTGEIDWK